MKRDLVRDVDRVMGEFFATATDDQFWAELESAGWAEFSKIDIPILDYHRRASHFRVTATEMSVPDTSVAFATILSEEALQGQLGGSFCGVTVKLRESVCSLAPNNDELALAA